MKGQAALLLVLLVAVLAPSLGQTPISYTESTSPRHPELPRTAAARASTTTRRASTTTTTTTEEPIYAAKSLMSSSTDADEVSSILSVDPKDVLVENMRSEDEDTNNEKVSERGIFPFSAY